jgi:phenylalanyl-tRNA synthetase beta chain
MFFLRSWLEDYVDLTGLSNSHLADLITTRSSEVEEFVEISDYFEGKVVVGKIQNTRNHPNADKLRIFDVFLGEDKKVQIVSAAPNVQDGLLVPVALEGAKLPGLTIVPRKMRGEESQGMCCGKSELMLETPFSDGLWELNDLLKNKNENEFLGESMCEVFPEIFPTETVFDIKVLPDKIGVIGNYLGMAVDLAICLEEPGRLKSRALRLTDPNFNIIEKITDFLKPYQGKIKLNFDDKTGYTNSFWTFKLDLNPKNESDFEYRFSHELSRRMFLTGINLVGGPADLSNYLLYDVGQPSHFFSIKKISQLKYGENSDVANENLDIDWKIEKAGGGEKFKGLGQLKNAQIPKGVEILKDGDDRILAVPAISGGEQTKVEGGDDKIILEIANFPADRVAKSSFALKYRSDGSKIWAGQVNPRQKLVFLIHLTEILGIDFELEVLNLWFNEEVFGWKGKGKEIIGALQTVLDYNYKQKIEVDFEYLADKLDGRGVGFWKPILEDKLKQFGEYKDGILLLHPYYSLIGNKDDLLMEVSKLIGYESLEPQALTFDTNIKTKKDYFAYYDLKKVLSDFGYTEVITRPFVPKDKLLGSLTGKDEVEILELANSYRSDEIYLRDSLFPTLLKTATENIKRGEKKVKIFELNKKYSLEQNEGNKGVSVLEEEALDMVLVSEDPYEATSLIRSLIVKMTGNEPKVSELVGDFTNLGEGFVYLGGEVDARLIQIKNSVKKSFEFPLDKTVWYISLEISNWNKKIQTYKAYFDESIYPSVRRSYSFVVGEKVFWNDMKEILEGEKINEVEIRINPKERLVLDDEEVMNFEVEFISYQKTLDGEEIESWEKLIQKSLVERFVGARVR